jgi:hypothetical protein
VVLQWRGRRRRKKRERERERERGTSQAQDPQRLFVYALEYVNEREKTVRKKIERQFQEEAQQRTPDP